MTHGSGTLSQTSRAGLPGQGGTANSSAPTGGWQPRVSVLMAAHNAARYIGAAIDSVLWQTFTDFELIVVDDGSTDGTADIVAGYADKRIRLVHAPRNLGVVQARNLGFSLATGTYLAIHDADDISHPTRLAREVSHLDTHPGDVLVSAEIRQLHPGNEMVRTRYAGSASPRVLDWMLHLGNPIAFSSTMMRMAALKRLPEFLREDRRYAEDFDLYARLRGQGGLSRLAMPLLVYRVYPESTSARHHMRMVEQTGRVLDEVWPNALFVGHERLGLAAMAARHLACGEPAENTEVLERLRLALDSLTEHFLAANPECTAAERDAVALYASRVWEHLVRLSLRAGTVSWPSGRGLRRSGLLRIGLGDALAAVVRAALPHSLRRLIRDPAEDAPGDGVPDSGKAARPPVLHVTVVLEGAAGGAEAQEPRQGAAFALQAQEVFDTYGLRPAYLLDRRMAGQTAACGALRNVRDAGGCAIGAWWSPGAAVAEVAALVTQLTDTLGMAPTVAAEESLAALPEGAAGPLLGIPGASGIMVQMTPVLDRVSGPGMGQTDPPLAGLSNRVDLARGLALLPHEIASEPLIMLIKTLLARGERDFFMRLNLRQGGPGAALALDRLRRVCAFFFEDLGGLPGNALALGGALPATAEAAA